MSLTARIRTILLLAVLEFGAVIGLPVPPEKIRSLMQFLHKQKMAHSRVYEQEAERFEKLTGRSGRSGRFSSRI